MALGELKSPELSYIKFLGLEVKKIQFRDGLLFPCSWHNPEASESSLLHPFTVEMNGEGSPVYL